MYREYCLVCKFEKKRVLNDHIFRNVFNTQFNLSFHPLAIDWCKTCDEFEASSRSGKITPEVRETFLLNKQNHQILARSIYNEQKACVEKSCGEKTVLLTFDLQRALEMPSVHTNVAYHKRQLWFYNLCIYDEKNKTAFMYVWYESTASRGSQKIGSCLFRHFLTYVPTDTKEIITWSDACGGQNRNIKLNLMLMKFLADSKVTNFERIDQRFFKSGHFYNKCDRCFGVIETQRKITENVLVPDQ